MKIQGNGHTLAHFTISMIFKPYSILDPTWGCPQDQKLTKTEKVKIVFGTNTKSFTIFRAVFGLAHLNLDKLQNLLMKIQGNGHTLAHFAIGAIDLSTTKVSV